MGLVSVEQTLIVSSIKARWALISNINNITMMTLHAFNQYSEIKYIITADIGDSKR